MTKVVLAGAALLALMAGVPMAAQAAPAIVNGGFEADTALVPVGGVYSGPRTGWNAGDLISTGYYQAAAPEGRVFALIGNGADLPGQDTSQTITGLTVGQTYKVKFELGGEQWRIPGGLEQVNVSITAGSASAAQIYTAPLSSNATAFSGGPLWDNWAFFTYDFVANATSATLDFQQTTATNGPGDTGLDNVSISLAGGVPEPATWALMISGFGLAGMALRRRRAIAA
jgi:hypothetical protein